MSKEDVVNAAASAIQSNQASALVEGLGAVYDQAQADKENSQGFTQADIDAAVAAAQQVDQEQLAAAKADADAKLADLQTQLAALADKETGEEKLIASLQSNLKSAQDAIAAVFALFPVPPAN